MSNISETCERSQHRLPHVVPARLRRNHEDPVVGNSIGQTQCNDRIREFRASSSLSERFRTTSEPQHAEGIPKCCPQTRSSFAEGQLKVKLTNASKLSETFLMSDSMTGTLAHHADQVPSRRHSPATIPDLFREVPRILDKAGLSQVPSNAHFEPTGIRTGTENMGHSTRTWITLTEQSHSLESNPIHLFFSPG